MNKNNDNKNRNMFEMQGGLQFRNFYQGKIDAAGEWKESTEARWKFKLYLTIISVCLILGTIINFNYLGGIEGILTSERLGYGKESFESYVAAVGSLAIMPLLAVFLLWIAYKKKKK